MLPTPQTLDLYSDRIAKTLLEIVAAAAGRAKQMYFGNDFEVTTKGDGTRVTSIDLAVNECLITALSRKFPNISFISEESEATDQPGPYESCWIIDPIDDTENLIHGLPGWNIMIALREAGGGVSLGLCYCPLTDRWIMARGGKGIAMSDGRVTLSWVDELKKAHIVVVSHGNLLRKRPIGGPWIIQSVRKVSNFGAFENIRHLICGNIDAIVTAGGAIWDLAPLALIIEEAGGTYSDFCGQPSIENRHAVYSNGHLHEKILALLKE